MHYLRWKFMQSLMGPTSISKPLRTLKIMTPIFQPCDPLAYMCNYRRSYCFIVPVHFRVMFIHNSCAICQASLSLISFWPSSQSSTFEHSLNSNHYVRLTVHQQCHALAFHINVITYRDRTEHLLSSSPLQTKDSNSFTQLLLVPWQRIKPLMTNSRH